VQRRQVISPNSRPIPDREMPATPKSIPPVPLLKSVLSA
jgi:hypothetical protein